MTNKPRQANENMPAGQTRDPNKWWRRTRIHVALLGMAIGAVNCYAQATFCIAIVEMVLPADYVIRLDDQMANKSTVFRVAVNTTTTRPETTNHPAQDQSCPVELKYRDYYDSWRFPDASITTTTTGSSTASNQTSASQQNIDVSDRFDWDASQQGLLLGAFAVGTAPLQVFGGRLAETYGAKWVLFAGCIGTALTNLSIPLIARFSFGLLLINRIFMGVAQAGMEPGLMCLLAEWLTPNETSFFISMLLFAICTGFFIGSLCSTFILTLNYGWPLAYYVSGGLNLVVGFIWILYADSSPRRSRYISPGELAFIEHEQNSKEAPLEAINDLTSTAYISTSEDEVVIGDDDDADIIFKNKNILQATFEPSEPKTEPEPDQQQQQQQVSSPPQPPMMTSQAPWRNILSTRSVWAFIICKFSVRWCADVMGNMLPLYFADVLHLSIKLNGTLNSISTALFAIFSFITGWLVNDLIAKQTPMSVDKTTLRKIFQSIASFGSALSVFLMTKYDCDIVFSMSMLLVVSCLLVMGTGGELQIPYDMTSKYPGTLHGMACTLSVSGWLAPPLIGLILGDQRGSRHRWSIVWYLTATINLLGGLVFVLFADASARDFDTPTRGKSSKGASSKAAATEETDQGGYYNAACKPLDNSPPPQTKRLSCQPQQLSATRDQNKTQDNLINHNNNNNNQDSLYFDTKLLKIRQSEESFLQLGSFYPANLDSPLASSGSNLFPYQENIYTTKQGHNDNETRKSQHKTNSRGLIELLANLARRTARKTSKWRPNGATNMNKSVTRKTRRPDETILPSGEARRSPYRGGRAMEGAKEETTRDKGWAPSVQNPNSHTDGGLRADVERQMEQTKACSGSREVVVSMNDNQLLAASVDKFNANNDTKEAPPMKFEQPKTITHL